MLAASIMCVFINLIIVANLIVSVVAPDRSPLSVILLTGIIDVAGAVLIIFLFNPTGSLAEGPPLILSP